MMKAMVLYGDYDVRYEEVAKPIPGYGQVLVKVKYTGVCATDLAIYTGNNTFKEQGLIRYPMIQGHEWSGEVVELGEGVTELQLGDRVIGDCAVTCGDCEECLAGNYVQCKHQRAVGTVNAWDGAMAEYILMPQRSVYKIPANISMEDAALVEPLAIGVYAIERGEIEIGDTVAIYGTGTIGFGALLGAVNSAAATVIFIGRKQEKLNLGKKLGADYCINTEETDVVQAVRKITNGKGANVVIDATGSPAVLKTCISITKDSGHLALPAFYDVDIDAFPIDDVVLRNIRVAGVSGSPNISPKVLTYMESGKFRVSELITGRFSLPDLEKAYREAIENRNNIKILIEHE